jgi:hypothetical protein
MMRPSPSFVNVHRSIKASEWCHNRSVCVIFGAGAVASVEVDQFGWKWRVAENQIG